MKELRCSSMAPQDWCARSLLSKGHSYRGVQVACTTIAAPQILGPLSHMIGDRPDRKGNGLTNRTPDDVDLESDEPIHLNVILRNCICRRQEPFQENMACSIRVH